MPWNDVVALDKICQWMWFLDSDRVRWSISSRPDWRADGLQAILTCRMTSDDWHRQHKGWPDSALVSQLATGTFLSLLSETEHHVWSFWWLLMRCFELLGIDVMLDAKMKPYLIEAGSLLWIQPKNQRCKIWDSYKYIYIIVLERSEMPRGPNLCRWITSPVLPVTRLWTKISSSPGLRADSSMTVAWQ